LSNLIFNFQLYINLTEVEIRRVLASINVGHIADNAIVNRVNMSVCFCYASKSWITFDTSEDNKCVFYHLDLCFHWFVKNKVAEFLDRFM
jgi:hypothetical protein